jgi:hypothetical protein
MVFGDLAALVHHTASFATSKMLGMLGYTGVPPNLRCNTFEVLPLHVGTETRLLLLEQPNATHVATQSPGSSAY